MALDPFIGEIAMFGFNFAPKGWATCDGQLLSIAQNTALFSLLGTTFGGDGQTTFGLPDLRGRVPVHQGQGPGLSSYVMGEKSGVESVTLLAGNLPAHAHTIGASTGPATAGSPAGNVMATVQDANRNGLNLYATTANATMAATSTVGSSSPIPVRQPYGCINYCIALQGIFPSRN